MRNGILAVGAAGLLSCVLCLSAQCRGAHHDDFRQDDHSCRRSGQDRHWRASTEPAERDRQRPGRADRVAGKAMPAVQERHGQEQSDQVRLPDRRFARAPAASAIWSIPRKEARIGRRSLRRERDRILQSMSEGFPPEYRLVSSATTGVWPKKRRFPPERTARRARPSRPGPRASEP